MMRSVRVVIVDDNPRARHGLRALLATQPGFEWIGEAVNGKYAIDLVAETKPDVVLMDIHMQEMNGLDAAAIIKEQHPEIKVVILTMYTSYLEQATLSGVDAFISKADPPERLLASIRGCDWGCANPR
jgi:YesN/AraC family two-component response regulator